jgi:hypothetical protein
MADYWAVRGRQRSGPHPTRDAAVVAFCMQHVTREGASRAAASIMTGYGTFGPSFDIQWRDPIPSGWTHIEAGPETAEPSTKVRECRQCGQMFDPDFGCDCEAEPECAECGLPLRLPFPCDCPTNS